MRFEKQMMHNQGVFFVLKTSLVKRENLGQLGVRKSGFVHHLFRCNMPNSNHTTQYSTTLGKYINKTDFKKLQSHWHKALSSWLNSIAVALQM
jgi:hypothetical protein